MSDSSSFTSFDSENYLKVVTEKVLTERKPKGNAKESSSERQPQFAESCSSNTEKDENIAFCVCQVCRERRKMAIGRDTVFKVEFQLHQLDSNEREFLKELTNRCRKANVSGYIMFTYGREDATGLMEGAIKDINKVKDWLEMDNKYIPEPISENFYISWYMIAREPTKLVFDERTKPPTPHAKSSDFGSSD
ncbi:uncharacterized protein LOC135434046 [Drosophila montana]|uniref:uncharacterized protein LOC135434046 n=1 Tax=Drosophila montana TaxID=40370 RepID=UPI00313E0AFB